MLPTWLRSLTPRSLAVVAVALLGAGFATCAAAYPNLNAPYLRPGCRVTASRWTVDCRSLADDNRCLVEVVEQVEGPCRIIETIDAQRFQTLLLDGAPPPPDGIATGQHTLLARGHRLILPTVHVTGSGGLDTLKAPSIARHPRLHGGRYPQTWRFRMAGRAVEGAINQPQQQVRLLLPEGWGISALSMGGPALAGHGVWHRHGDSWVGDLQTTAPTNSAAILEVEVHRIGHLLRHGGPMLAAGAAWGSRAAGLRVRTEYEAEIAGFFLPGVAVDFDTVSGWQLSPRLEVATSQLWGLPMLGLGVGTPFDLANGLRSQGLRVYGSLQLGTLGLVFGADTPLIGAAETRYALLLRGSM